MTQEREQAKKIAELNSLFMVLNEKGQENALNILRALQFAQSVVVPEEPRQAVKHSTEYS